MVWPVLLSAGTAQTITVNLPSQLETFTVRLKRPTTAKPLNWDEASTVRVHAVLIVDGVEQKFIGRSTGGIRQAGGVDLGHYQFKCTPTWGFVVGAPKRLGETCSSYQLRIDLERVSGTIETELQLQTTRAPAPQA